MIKLITNLFRGRRAISAEWCEPCSMACDGTCRAGAAYERARATAYGHRL